MSKLSSAIAALPNPIADLDQIVTVGQALSLATQYPDLVSIEETRGVGRSRGKVYVRFHVEGVVRRDGKLYPDAHSKTPSLREDTVPVIWYTFMVLPGQALVLLLIEQDKLRQKYLSLASKADQLYAMLVENLEPRSLEGHRPEKIWLTICHALISQKLGRSRSFRPYLYSRDVGQAAAETFGISQWTDLATITP
jgi:hypothetical protein